MNHVTLVGRLTATPTLRYAGSDGSVAVVNYTIAVNRRFSNKESEENKADFIRCVSFKKSAEFATKYFEKGKRVAIEGRLQTGKYKNKEGVDIYTTVVIVENQEFADSPAPTISKKEESASVLDGFTDADEYMDMTTDDEVPF